MIEGRGGGLGVTDRLSLGGKWNVSSMLAAGEDGGEKSVPVVAGEAADGMTESFSSVIRESSNWTSLDGEVFGSKFCGRNLLRSCYKI